jgi:hypothetical protein
MDSRLLTFNPETDALYRDAIGAGAFATEPEAPGILGDAGETELATALMESGGGEGLKHLLNALFKRLETGTAPKAQVLGELLHEAAFATLPFLAAIGTSSPSVTPTSGEVFGLELEGLSPEDQEFEAAKAFVRLAAAAARALAATSAPTTPALDARRALCIASAQHAPGLLLKHGHPCARSKADVFLSSPTDPARIARRGSAPLSKEIIMHDIDRTSLEFGQQEYGGQFGEFGQQGEQGEFGQQEAFGQFGEFSQSEWGGEAESEVLGEAEQLELAAELLNVNNEADLEQFLGDLVKTIGRAAGTVIRSPIGQALGSVLKSAAGKVLPMAGGAIGGYVGGPLGAKIGSGLANAAGKALGLEAESLSYEDREFEGAKQFVKLASQTVKNAAAAPGGDPMATAQRALLSAAQKLAPALVGGAQQMPALPGQGSMMQQGPSASARRNTGRWVRKGKVIVLLGA